MNVAGGDEGVGGAEGAADGGFDGAADADPDGPGGIEPEELDYVTMQPVAAGYMLRPEAIESAYYLYRITGDRRYREMGRGMVDSLFRYCGAETGFAALGSVVTKEPRDQMESFFLAETLKYAYLLFAPSAALDFDAVVFNTVAHPIRRTW